MSKTNFMTENKNCFLPKITVVTPVKNSVNTLEKAIKSVIKQNYPNLEYIILDGGSTDGTLEVIKKYENFINHWESKNDGGNVMAYIEGIKKANGEIIGFLNADDFYEDEVLTKAGAEFTKNPDLDLVSFLLRVLRSDGKKYKTIEASTVEGTNLDREKIIGTLGINARFFKKEVFEKFGMPLPKDDQDRAFLSNDLEYMIRFTLLGIKNKTLDYFGYNYLSHEESLTFSKNLKNQIRLCEDRIYIAKKFLNSNDLEIPQIWRKTFKKWIKKYRALIVKMNLKQIDFREAVKNTRLGVKENGVAKFLFYFFKTLFRH